METVQRGTLNNQIFYLAGFGFGPHPLQNEWYIQISVYQRDDLFIICLSEGKGKGNPTEAKGGLWQPVLGRYIAPYAIRQIRGITSVKEVRDILSEAWPETEWTWS